MTTIEEYSAAFDEDPGYLDFASFGPLAAAAVAEQSGWDELLRRGRHGSLAALEVLRAIHPFGEDSAGKLLLADTLALRFRTLTLPSDPGCRTCGS